MCIGKKGMVIGQVFIFIVAAITFAVILIFGYSSISDFITSGEQVEFYQFKTDLETSVKKIYTEYGSIRVKEFSPPVKYTQICFIDLNKKFSSVSFPKGDCVKELKDAYACDVWEDSTSYDSTDQNVFLKPISPVKIKVYDISMDKDYLCVDIEKGKFSLTLEGKGDRTHLSKS